MGQLVSIIFSKVSSDKGTSRILMLGLDSAGKTTVLYKMKTKRTEMTVPTIGFNVETISLCKGMDVTVWDVGGQDKFRPLWRHYFENTKGLFFIIDSNDRERIAEAKEALFSILESESMAAVPLVVIANKQDLPNAMGPLELETALNLSSLSDRKWIIQKTCAIKGDGLIDAMKEMARLIKERKKEKR